MSTEDWMDQNDFMNDLRLRIMFNGLETIPGPDQKALPEITDDQLDAFIANRKD